MQNQMKNLLALLPVPVAILIHHRQLYHLYPLLFILVLLQMKDALMVKR